MRRAAKHGVEHVRIGQVREPLDLHFAQRVAVDIDHQLLPLAVDARRIEGQGILMTRKPVPRFDHEEADPSLQRINQSASQLAENGIGCSTDDRVVQLALAERPEAVGVDKAEVGS